MGDLIIEETLNNNEIFSMVSANIYNQLNNIMATNTDNEKENSDESTHNNQISELTQEVQNMGKALAVISEKTNAITERPNNPIQQLNPRTMNPNMGQYQNVNPTMGQYQNTNITLQPPPRRIQWTTPKPQRRQFMGRYCHSCGNCDHWSNRCMWQKRGHNIEATWLDKKCGSLNKCGNY